MMEEALAALLVLALGLVFAALLRRRPKEPSIVEDVEDKEQAHELTAFWLSLKDHCPYLPTPTLKDTSSESIVNGITDVFTSCEQYGWMPAFNWLPVPALPLENRRRHLVVFGKTGSGKSTFLEHLIEQNARQGHGVAVISPEGELFRDRVLNLIPEERHHDVIYCAPSNPQNAVTFNPLALEPGDDAIQAADDLFGILKRTLQEDSLGPQMKPLLQNALAALVGREGATLFDVNRLFEDSAFRADVLRDGDYYVRDYWTKTFPGLRKNAALPIKYRLDQFFRTPKLRRTLCNPAPGLSIRQALRDNKILLLDLFGLNEEQLLLMGQLLLSKFQLELLRREVSGEKAPPYFLYCDEFQSFAGMAPGLWRGLLSRGRKYGLALTLANQFPGQLPTGVRDEIFGNVNSIVSFELGGSDANVVRKELLRREVKKDTVTMEPVPVADLLELSVGQAMARLGGGKAIRIETLPPLSLENEIAGELAAASWARYGSPPIEEKSESRISVSVR